MKKLLLIILVLLGIDSESQEPYYYLNIVVENGDSWVNIRNRPEKMSLIETTGSEAIRTVDFDKFLIAEPVITKKEGFLLAMELENWRRISLPLYQLQYLKNLNEDIIFKIGEEFSLNFFSKSSKILNRDESLLLWLFVTRIIILNGNKKLPLDIKDRSKEVALIGEHVWNSLDKGPFASDIHIYSLHSPSKYSVSLLVDCSGNIITKMMICPELYFQKDTTQDLLDLVEKSSKEFKFFANVSRERKKERK